MENVLFSQEKICSLFNDILKELVSPMFSLQNIQFVGDEISHDTLAVECTYQIFSYTCVFKTPILEILQWDDNANDENFIRGFNHRLRAELSKFEELKGCLVE